jgi:hypothetical protein
MLLVFNDFLATFLPRCGFALKMIAQIFSHFFAFNKNRIYERTIKRFFLHICERHGNENGILLLHFFAGSVVVRLFCGTKCNA